jgi:D-alanyl-D-alanine carboxypeptidase
MREFFLLITIILGQFAPSSPLLERVTNKIRISPSPVIANKVPLKTESIVAKPVKTMLNDYSAAAKAVYSIDVTSNAVLTSKDSDKRLPIASLTKLMTAYIIFKEENLNDVFTVTDVSGQEGDAVIGLVGGDQLSVRSLLDGLLINSGSDAAYVLAVGNAGSVSAFVSKMNSHAKALGLANTHFVNPVGWDDANNYSSAKDMTELARILLRNNTFSEIIKTKNKTITTIAGRNISLSTTNQLLLAPGYVGVKTGYTYGAGECLISLYKSNDGEILTTVIGSSARFFETNEIKEWILSHFLW